MNPILKFFAAFGLIFTVIPGVNASPFPAFADEIVSGIYSTDM